MSTNNVTISYNNFLKLAQLGTGDDLFKGEKAGVTGSEANLQKQIVEVMKGVGITVGDGINSESDKKLLSLLFASYSGHTLGGNLWFCKISKDSNGKSHEEKDYITIASSDLYKRTPSNNAIANILSSRNAKVEIEEFKEILSLNYAAAGNNKDGTLAHILGLAPNGKLNLTGANFTKAYNTLFPQGVKNSTNDSLAEIITLAKNAKVGEVQSSVDKKITDNKDNASRAQAIYEDIVNNAKPSAELNPGDGPQRYMDALQNNTTLSGPDKKAIRDILIEKFAGQIATEVANSDGSDTALRKALSILGSFDGDAGIGTKDKKVMQDVASATILLLADNDNFKNDRVEDIYKKVRDIFADDKFLDGKAKGILQNAADGKDAWTLSETAAMESKPGDYKTKTGSSGGTELDPLDRSRLITKLKNANDDLDDIAEIIKDNPTWADAILAIMSGDDTSPDTKVLIKFTSRDNDSIKEIIAEQVNSLISDDNAGDAQDLLKSLNTTRLKEITKLLPDSTLNDILEFNDDLSSGDKRKFSSAQLDIIKDTVDSSDSSGSADYSSVKAYMEKKDYTRAAAIILDNPEDAATLLGKAYDAYSTSAMNSLFDALAKKIGDELSDGNAGDAAKLITNISDPKIVTKILDALSKGDNKISSSEKSDLVDALNSGKYRAASQEAGDEIYRVLGADLQCDYTPPPPIIGGPNPVSAYPRPSDGFGGLGGLYQMLFKMLDAPAQGGIPGMGMPGMGMPGYPQYGAFNTMIPQILAQACGMQPGDPRMQAMMPLMQCLHQQQFPCQQPQQPIVVINYNVNQFCQQNDFYRQDVHNYRQQNDFYNQQNEFYRQNVSNYRQNNDFYNQNNYNYRQNNDFYNQNNDFYNQNNYNYRQNNDFYNQNNDFYNQNVSNYRQNNDFYNQNNQFNRYDQNNYMQNNQYSRYDQNNYMQNNVSYMQPQAQQAWGCIQPALGSLYGM